MPGDAEAPGPSVFRKVNSVIFCCVRLIVTLARKGRPWLIDNEFAAQQYDRTRKVAAALINAAPEDVALISSVGYGVSTAAKVFAVPTGSRVLVLQDDHSSAVLEWLTRAGAGGFSVETVRRP